MSVASNASGSDFTRGLGILLIAQFLSAYMGAYVEDTYAEYKTSWTENLFYSHFLSLPFFLPLSSNLRNQYRNLAATPYVNVRQFVSGALIDERAASTATTYLLDRLCAYLETIPEGILLLLMNGVTQLACISGVNVLSAKSSQGRLSYTCATT